ncbi:unnamed protein product [Diabrotica balteata]|uniref:Uncharacterized protein n=1 Tax=Diabrotica balteata TaxID=107213 RepID=A0A9N9SXI0_DIABA|nr:unnamed protein product [Diabrotica balteata]
MVTSSLKAAGLRLLGPGDLFVWSTTTIAEIAKCHFHTQTVKRWEEGQGCRLARVTLRNLEKLTSKKYLGITRKNLHLTGREFGFIITDVRHVNDDDDDGYYLGSNDEFDFGEEEYLEVEEETDSNPPVDDHEESQSPSIIYSMSEDEYDYNVELDDPDESRSPSMYTMSDDDYYDYDVVLGEPVASRSPSVFTMSEDDDCDVPSDCFSYGSEEILHTEEIPHTKEDSSPKVAESNSSIEPTDC